MALLIDGNVSTGEDLRAYESSILDVANTEGIDLDAKIDLAGREMEVEISAYLLEQNSMYTVAAVMVTEAMAQWHAQKTLALIYRDAYNSQLNDRYAGKWKQYESLAKQTRALTLETGIGISLFPVPRAKAPVCDSVGGGNLAQSTYYVQIAWVGAQGRLGEASELTSFVSEAGRLLRIEAVAPPTGATGWVVYIGVDPSSLHLQPGGPVAIGSAWILPVSGPTPGGALPADLTVPDLLIRRRSLFRRG